MTETQTPELVPDLPGVYNEQAAELARMKEENATIVFDYEDPEGNKDARSHVYKLRRSKGAVAAVHKTAKADALFICNELDRGKRELTAIIDEMIEVHAAPLREIEEREAEEKRLKEEAEAKAKAEAEAREQERLKAKREAEEAEFRAKRKELEREQRALKEEKAKIDRAKREEEIAREARERAEREAKEAVERAEREAQEAKEREARARQEAEDARKREEERKKAEAEAEAKRVAEEAEAKRQANLRWESAMRAVAEELSAYELGDTPQDWTAIVTDIAAGRIPHLRFEP